MSSMESENPFKDSELQEIPENDKLNCESEPQTPTTEPLSSTGRVILVLTIDIGTPGPTDPRLYFICVGCTSGLSFTGLWVDCG